MSAVLNVSGIKILYFTTFFNAGDKIYRLDIDIVCKHPNFNRSQSEPVMKLSWPWWEQLACKSCVCLIVSQVSVEVSHASVRVLQASAKVLQTSAKVLQTSAKVLQTSAKVLQASAKVSQTSVLRLIYPQGFINECIRFWANLIWGRISEFLITNKVVIEKQPSRHLLVRS